MGTCDLLKIYFWLAIVLRAFTTQPRPKLDRRVEKNGKSPAASVWVKGKDFHEIAAAMNSCGFKLAFIFSGSLDPQQTTSHTNVWFCCLSQNLVRVESRIRFKLLGEGRVENTTLHHAKSGDLV